MSKFFVEDAEAVLTVNGLPKKRERERERERSQCHILLHITLVKICVNFGFSVKQAKNIRINRKKCYWKEIILETKQRLTKKLVR